MNNEVNIESIYTNLELLQDRTAKIFIKNKKIWKDLKENKQFGYFASNYILNLYKFIQSSNYNSFIELGAGTGFIGEILKKGKHIEYKGFEIEQELIDLSKKLKFSIQDSLNLKDILTIESEDLKINNIPAEIIYLYEPFLQNNEQKRFIQRLSEKMFVGQQLIYNYVAGTGIDILSKKVDEGLFEFYIDYPYYSVHTFKKIKPN